MHSVNLQCLLLINIFCNQSHRVQAVIGKFEHSFKVTSSTTGTNLQPAVATLHATGAQLTAVDIQSFSLLVTELIVTASHRNKLGCFLPKLKAKSSDRLNSEATASDNVYNWLSSSGEALQRLLQLVMNMDNDQRAKPNGRQETLSRKRSYSSIGPSERSSTWSADSRSIDLSRPTTASTYDDCDSRGSSSCTCADRVTDIRARRRPHHHTPGHHRRSHCIDGSKDVCGSNGEGSPWQRAWFSDSESSAFREVNVPLRTNSSLGNLMGVNQRKHREHRFSGRQPSVVGTRLRHNILALQSENLMERDTTMSSDDVCTDCQRRDEVAGRRKSDGHTFDCISLTSGDSVSSMTSSSVASGCHPAQILARHQPMTTCRTKRRLAANGCTNRSSDGVSLVKSASYSGLKAISETGSVGRDATDTTSNASCSLCLRVDGILKTDVSHPALRGLYLSTIGVATTRTGSSAIDSDISSCSSSSSMSSDSRDIHSFSNESR